MPSEQQRYEALIATEPDFLKGAQLVVEAMLQSPNFLFWLDTTPDPKLKAWATASRLSYSLWDTMPDAELFARRRAGRTGDAGGCGEAARRMLADPRAHESLDEFVSQWLRFDRLLTASKDRRKFPLFTRETAERDDRQRRARSSPTWSGTIGNFMTLFTADYGYVSPELARIYGVPAPAKDFDRVAFPAGSERAGILGQGLFLALTAKPEDSSPTARGLFVREQFLCQHVPDPPPGVNTNLPPVTEAKPQTNRDRMSEHATNPTCATCHKLMDAVGFGLEKFDAIGRAAGDNSAGVSQDLRGRRRGRRHKPVRSVTSAAGYGSVCGRNSGFAVHFAAAAGRSAGEKLAVPGVHCEAVFPVSGRKDGNGGGSPADPDGLGRVPRIRVTDSRSSWCR